MTGRRGAGLLLITLGVLLGLAAPASAAPTHTARSSGQVIVIGVPGLRWDDLSAAATPALWRLAGNGSIGTLSARSTRALTCPDDGWVTLGAGARAQRGPHRATPRTCPNPPVRLVLHADGSAVLDDQPDVVLRNAPAQARPGALAESLRCATAIGSGAAIAAARPVGRITQYLPKLPARPRAVLARCPLTVVDAGQVSGGPAARRAAVRAADRLVGQVVAARAADSTVLVAGVSDTGTPARLHVAIADGPDFRGGWLTSGSTNRTGYVQLADVAPTVTDTLGLRRPAAFAGQPWQHGSARTATMPASRDRLVDADRSSVATAGVAGWFVAVLVASQLVLYLLVGFGLSRLVDAPDRIRAVIATAATAAALVVPAMLLANVAPWWRSGAPGWTFLAVTAGWLAVATAVVRLGPWRRWRLGQPAATAAVAVAVIGVDVVSGAHLELDNVVGYAAVTGDRYTGLGMVGLGAFAAAVLALAGCLAVRVPRRYRPVLMALVGGAGVVAVGGPFFGADPGAAIGMTAGAAVAAVLSRGGFLTVTRLGWAFVAGLGVTGAFALLDLTRPPEQRGHLARFVSHLFGGTAGPALHRVMQANTMATVGSLLSLLVVVAAVFVGLVLLGPAAGLRRVYGLFPSLRGALAGAAVAAVLAGLFDGAGLIVAGAAASVAVPLAVQYCLQVTRPERGEPTG